MKPLSYAQNLEDYHLSLLFPGKRDGFYIDVGGGHVVADNVSYYFYELGWRGIVVEPQEMLAQAYRTVRPRDVLVQALAGRAAGEMEFFEAKQYHGLSTTIASHAETAAIQGVETVRKTLPVTTLGALSGTHAPKEIDFLKIDVEGAEAEVLAGNDWTRYRPKVVVLEAIVPFSMADASASFEPQLLAAGYQFAYFDNLNRFYVANESADLIERFPKTPSPWDCVRHLGEYLGAHKDVTHPDHALAKSIDPKLYSRLNNMSAVELAGILPDGIDPRNAATRAALARIASLFDGGYVV